MSPRQWLLVIGILAAGAVTASVLWLYSPAPPVTPPTNVQAPNSQNAFQAPPIDVGSLLNPAKLVTFIGVNKSSRSCKVTVTGGGDNFHSNISADVPAGQSRNLSSVNGPFTIQAVTVERDGKSRRHDLKVPVAAGEKKEIRVNEDDTIEVAPAGK
jgi:hypothetical protein